MATPSKPFERFAGACALGAGVGALLYSVSFIVAVRTDIAAAGTAAALLLLAGGFLTLPVAVALYLRLRPAEEGFALWALLLSVVGDPVGVVTGLSSPRLTPDGGAVRCHE